jgi:hypothetical protein
MLMLARITDLQADLRDRTKAMRQASEMRRLAEVLDPPAAEPEAEAAPHRHRHRKTSPAQRALRVVDAAVLIAGGLGAALKYIVAAHRPMAAALGSAAAVLTAATVTGVPGAIMSPSPARAAAVPAPAASAAPVPSSPPLPPARPSADGGAHRTRPSAFSTAPVAPPAAPGSSASPSASPSATPLPPLLVVSATQISLGVAAAGQVTLTAERGQVDWRATAGSGVSLSAYRGALQAGQPVTVVIAVLDPSLAGSADIRFWPGGAVITVTWDALSVLPSPTLPVP